MCAAKEDCNPGQLCRMLTGRMPEKKSTEKYKNSVIHLKFHHPLQNLPAYKYVYTYSNNEVKPNADKQTHSCFPDG